MLKFCRLCAELKKPQELKTKIDDPIQRIEEKLIDCCRWNSLTEAYNLPRDVCSICFEKLEQSWAFAEHVASAQVILHRKFKKQKANIESVQNIANALENNGSNETDSPEEVNFVAVKVESDCLSYFEDFRENGFPKSDHNEDSRYSIAIDQSTGNESLGDASNSTENDDGSFEEFSKECEINIKSKELDFLSVLTKDNCNADGTITDDGLLKLKTSSWNDYQYKCSKCKTTSKGVDEFRSHIETAHPNEPSLLRYACSDCPKKYIQFGLFAYHVGTTHRPHLKYCCYICSTQFWDIKLMKRHLYKHPYEHRSLMCETCGKSFTQYPYLLRHIKMHSTDKPFICDLCNKPFKLPVHLKKHKLIHTDVKPHKCESCGKNFRSNSTLKEHMRIHSGALPYACEFCGKQFRTSGVLTIHRRSHTGERPYSCKECQHKFSNWCNFNKHMKRKHGIDTSKRQQPTTEIINAAAE